MAGRKVFISYSHQDQAYLEEWQKYLRFWQQRDILDIWSDQRIQPGQEWEREIQQAIANAGLAVLLVSPDFLSSDYIINRELPPLLTATAEKKLALTCLFLRPSSVTEKECTFSDSRGNTVRLTDYQGLNSPSEVISKFPAGSYEREQRLLNASRQLREMARQFGVEAPPKQQSLGKELMIRLRVLRGDHLLCDYSVPGCPFFKQDSLFWRTARDWLSHWLANGALLRDVDQIGDTLFELLMGPVGQDLCKLVLSAAFDMDDVNSPEVQPVRLRIQTDEPLLVQFPWWQTSWEKRLLSEYGWTFEFSPVAASHPTAYPDYKDVQLVTPCEILLIMPEIRQGGLRSEPHRAGLERLFQTQWADRVWPQRREPATDPGEIKKQTEEHWSQIVYYYGRAETINGQLLLLLQNGERLALQDLVGLLTAHSPKLLFLNLVGNTARQGIHQVAALLPVVPFVAVQVTPHEDTQAAREAAIGWLRAVLQGSDPVLALHTCGLPDAVAWTAYRSWQPQVASSKLTCEVMIEAFLDRHDQRNKVTGDIRELVRNSKRRLLALVVYGERGNRVKNFSTQLIAHLRRDAKDVVNLKHESLRFKNPAKLFTFQDLTMWVCDLYELGPRSSVFDKFRQIAPEPIAKGFPLLLFDWKMDHYCQDLDLLKKQLTVWLTYCRDEWAHYCPAELRLVSYLALECPASKTSELEKILNDLYDQFNSDRSFNFEFLPPLTNIPKKELRQFFNDTDYCPDKIRVELPKLIYENTGGKFDETVKWLKRCARSEWYEIYYELLAKHGEQCGITDTDNEN